MEMKMVTAPVSRWGGGRGLDSSRGVTGLHSHNPPHHPSF